MTTRELLLRLPGPGGLLRRTLEGNWVRETQGTDVIWENDQRSNVLFLPLLDLEPSAFHDAAGVEAAPLVEAVVRAALRSHSSRWLERALIWVPTCSVDNIEDALRWASMNAPTQQLRHRAKRTLPHRPHTGDPIL